MMYENRLKKSKWKVADISYSAASSLIEKFHYAKSASKSAVAIHGLFMTCDDYNVLPFGLCWWLPLPSATAASFFHNDYKNVLGLSRLVLTPDAPKNAASFLLSRSIKKLPKQYHTLATYADEWSHHTGNVYLACNWQYVGLNDGKPRWVDSDGRLVSNRNGRRTLTKDEMEAAGYTFLGYFKAHRYVYHRKPMALNHNVQQLPLFTIGGEL